MALHTELAIYKAAYDLLSIATDYVRNIPRSLKPFLGLRVGGLCVELVLLIAEANAAADKVPHLTLLLRRVDELNTLLRLCRDKRFISTDQYARAVVLTTSVGKQANGWKRKYAASPVT